MRRPDRLSQLAEDLMSQTRQGKVEWEPGAQADSYVWSTPNGSVTISRFQGQMARERYRMVVADGSGNPIDDISGDAREQHAANLPPGQVSYFGQLKNLWEEIRLAVGYVDEVLDSLFEELHPDGLPE